MSTGLYLQTLQFDLD